ncbi:uncharacterized protein HD556DRAFT_1442166 [Suillus plorans]|uniref:Uncharacterized protein n=1 Tax=Suillus plorans TaxID=116603 RepID=A0A9P7DI20_9AGAM|nr:uncharacterized protein HD556DRAFT_1442166 [Suillus plorans]KAG1795318.1 hypothetical protein HD556DRAFT_1442166 [Suillus plorans]
MADVTDDWIDDDSEDEDALRPLDQSVERNPVFYRPGKDTTATLAADSIRPPTTPSGVSDLIEEVDPVVSIADRAKTRTRKTQVKKPTYESVNHDVIELTSDSNLDELSLKHPRKRQKSQDKPVKSKPRPRPKPKPKARTSPSPKVPE